MTTTIALVGNPNSGKTTLFNTLTGGLQRTGNWPGVTVEKKTGKVDGAQSSFNVIDLPGLYNLTEKENSEKLDEAITRTFLTQQHADVIVNVVDATTMARGLFLTTQLRELNTPIVVALTMSDLVAKQSLDIDCSALSARLGCPVVLVDATRSRARSVVLDAVNTAFTAHSEKQFEINERFEFVDQLFETVVSVSSRSKHITHHIDRWVLNRYLAIPIFLLVMYLMFFFSINVGSVFIDFFDIIGGAIFVETPRMLLQSIGSPSWFTAFVADGAGAGVQLVCTFIPVIGALFLFLSVLEDSGYMGRVAFILDKPLRALGLPGKAFVPLIVGFGCNVPSVMGTRGLDSKPDRILTTIMAPFMSCGARLTVYVLFVAAFFPRHGQNIVFLLYVLGILVAVGTAWIVRKQLLVPSSSTFAQELPKYHLPTWRNLMLHTWQRLRDFVWRAGRAIVAVVVVLQIVNSVGTDGTFGNENTEKSLLSEIGRTITPIFAPMGINDENWPATVGIFTGFFAKEVVVETLDALCTPDADSTDQFNYGTSLTDAVTSVPQNLGALGSTFLDPLGLSVNESETLEASALQNDVDINTVLAMQALFDGKLGAFSYLLFLLLYVPCVATIGVILREIGGYWATFSVVWSVTIAYVLAVSVYQLGQFGSSPIKATLWIASMVALASVCMLVLSWWGRHAERSYKRLPNVVQLD
ncbi:MAG: ferrous iron transport protein B [Gammaproteobacteria bacterium]|nr:ferrous iron transport protein B [Gammaproteobacteria bacterium]MYF39005.1 ferrous iron transport protein B [Gammaproteobacteria bacterium]